MTGALSELLDFHAAQFPGVYVPTAAVSARDRQNNTLTLGVARLSLAPALSASHMFFQGTETRPPHGGLGSKLSLQYRRGAPDASRELARSCRGGSRSLVAGPR